MKSTPHATPYDYAGWLLAALAVIFVLEFRLVPALIAGLLVYELVHAVIPVFARHLSGNRAKAMAVALVTLLVLGTVTFSLVGIILFMKSEGGSLAALLSKMAEVLDSTRATLPLWLADYLPSRAEGIGEFISQWLRGHASEVQQIGRRTGHTLAHVLIGMVIGALVSLRSTQASEYSAPLAQALGERVFRLGEAFRRIVFAQARISLINTGFTALYLALALPLFGVNLPLTKTMIVVTLITGMLPVVGNLVSNSIIFVISLAHSPAVAISSLSFLILIHKLEYFLNAHIIGSRIRARAWELLTAMLFMESAFGLAGLVMAPICYAWLKDELEQRGLI